MSPNGLRWSERDFMNIRKMLISPVLLTLMNLAQAGEYSVPIFDVAKAYPGKTLLTDVSRHWEQRIVEVDFNGDVAWQHTPSLPQRGLLLDASYLANGHILFTAKGMGIVEIDRQGRVHWEHKDAEASHDADRLDNGNTLYNRSWVAKGEDVVREISPSGQLVWSWNGVAAFDVPPYNNVNDEGWMHVNAVSRMPNGNTLISIRNFNIIVEVNSSGDVVRRWSFGCDPCRTIPTKGRIKGQRNHEPELLANGNILVALRSPFRFVEFDPETEQIKWQWRPADSKVNMSFNRDANRLPNGNTLVTTANQVIEVTPDGTVVWLLQGPSRTSTGDPRVFHKALRSGQDGRIHGD